MTPFLIASDLHLDAKPYIYLEDDLKYLADFEGYFLLPGDTIDFGQRELYEDFLAKVFYFMPRLKALVAVLGNHEYYGTSFEKAEAYFTNLKEEFPKYVLLNGESNVWLDGDYLFVGDTLWYPETPDVYLRTSGLADFSEISALKFPEIFARNKALKRTVEQVGHPEGVKLIWLTHHLPSVKSISAYYARDSLNCYFVDPSFEDYVRRYSPDLLVHGHSHHVQHYQLGDTYVVSNPRGKSARFQLDRFVVLL